MRTIVNIAVRPTVEIRAPSRSYDLRYSIPDRTGLCRALAGPLRSTPTFSANMKEAVERRRDKP
jgi:hypothetical protein